MKVFIGCSSRDKIDRIYIEQARCLADYLAKNNYDLLTGGAVGVMQVVIDSFKKNKRDITVMVVDGYQEVLDKSLRLYHYKRVGDRKYALINNANLAIFLPGGIGTYDEIFTAIESKRAREHDLNIIIVNINGYYDGIIKQLDRMYQEKFADYNNNLYYISNDIDSAIKYIKELGVDNGF